MLHIQLHCCVYVKGKISQIEENAPRLHEINIFNGKVSKYEIKSVKKLRFHCETTAFLFWLQVD